MLGLGATGQFAIGQVDFGFIIDWYKPLSEPPRSRRLFPCTYQFSAFHPAPVVSFSWFEALSEPPRLPVGLRPPLKQFLAQPPQLRPTPTISAVMASSESGDDFLGGGSVFNQPASAETGVREILLPGAETGVSTTPAAVSAATSVRIIE